MTALALAPEGTPERDAQDMAFLEHLSARHGLNTFECPKCKGAGCATCDGEGVLFTTPTSKPCGPGCIAPVRFELAARESRS